MTLFFSLLGLAVGPHNSNSSWANFDEFSECDKQELIRFWGSRIAHVTLGSGFFQCATARAVLIGHRSVYRNADRGSSGVGAPVETTHGGGVAGEGQLQRVLHEPVVVLRLLVCLSHVQLSLAARLPMCLHVRRNQGSMLIT